jgi:hypothetical protein
LKSKLDKSRVPVRFARLRKRFAPRNAKMLINRSAVRDGGGAQKIDWLNLLRILAVLSIVIGLLMFVIFAK